MSVPGATDGMFCDTAPLIVANGQVWDGLFCLDGAVVIPPVSGGGGSSAGVSAPGNYYNQSPDTRRIKDKFLKQAIQEDEEMLLMIKAFVETIQ